MTIYQLECFIAVAEELNFSAAAERLFTTQPAITYQINALEKETGLHLFERTTRRTKLTAAGQSFYLDMVQMTSFGRQALKKAQDIQDADRSHLTVGLRQLFDYSTFSSILAQFQHQFPNACVDVVPQDNRRPLEQLRSGQLDIGFFYTTRPGVVSGLRAVPLYREPVYIMVSWDHPLAQKKGLKYEALEGMQFMYPHDTCCFVGEFLPMLEKMGIHLSKTTFLGGVQLVVEQVRKEGAMTLAPHCAAQHYHDAYGLVRLDMDEDPIWAWENIVYKNYETLKPAARALARSSAVYADELVKKDASGWIARPNGTA